MGTVPFLITPVQPSEWFQAAFQNDYEGSPANDAGIAQAMSQCTKSLKIRPGMLTYHLQMGRELRYGFQRFEALTHSRSGW